MNWDKKENWLNGLVTFKRKILFIQYGLFAVVGFLVAYNIFLI